MTDLLSGSSCGGATSLAMLNTHLMIFKASGGAFSTTAMKLWQGDLRRGNLTSMHIKKPYIRISFTMEPERGLQIVAVNATLRPILGIFAEITVNMSVLCQRQLCRGACDFVLTGKSRSLLQ